MPLVMFNVCAAAVNALKKIVRLKQAMAGETRIKGVQFFMVVGLTLTAAVVAR